MEKFVIKSNTLENALEKASKKLNLPVERLNYRVINDKRGFFKKSIEIEVFSKENIEDFGYVSISEGRFIIEDPKNGEKPAKINIPSEISLFLDDNRVYGEVELLGNNNIKYNIDKKNSKRNLTIKTSEDGMKANLWIDYEPEISYSLQDSEKVNRLSIEIKEIERIYPPKFTREEIKKAIEDNGIIFGILEDKLKEIETMKEVKGILIAKGIKPIDDIEDKLNIFFDESIKSKDENDLERVDYKNFYSIANVEANNPIGELIEGSKGEDGKDIFGVVKKRKTFNKIKLKLGEGCRIDENKVIALIDGRPCIKGGAFYVYKVFNQELDVDVKSGNINFIGDVHIKGEIKDGMRVNSGNTLIVEKNAEGAILISKGEMILKGNIIRSKVIAGGDNTLIMNELSILNGIRRDISELIDAVTQIKERNLYGNQIRDGEIIMALLEKKFKILNSKIMIFLMNTTKQEIEEDKLKLLLKTKIFSLGVTEIKSYNELYEIVEILDSRIKTLSSQVKLPVNLYINYSQDSNIESSGDVIFTGKGTYLSNISAQGSIYFKASNSIVRGGAIKAEKEIRCKVVGSEGGGKTILATSKKGHIYSDIVYIGTKFIFGSREYSIEVPCRNVHAYMDENGEVNVDKFVL